MTYRDDIERLIDEHLAGPALRALPGDRLRRLVTRLGGDHGGHTPEDALAVIEPLGLAEDVRAELARIIEQVQALGMGTEHTAPVTQAYVRGLGRISEAEAAHLRAFVLESPPEERMAVLDRVLPGLMDAGSQAFETLHRVLLHDALHDELADDRALVDDQVDLTVALVDLTGSTTYLAAATPAETRGVVDGLFAAGQGAAIGRPVRVVKYVGDGFFLVGRDPVAVIDACWAAIDRIQEQLPLRARAGVADGLLVRRAGDLFGLPVNLAQALTKATAPGTVVVSAELGTRLPEEVRVFPGKGVLPGGRELALFTVRRS